MPAFEVAPVIDTAWNALSIMPLLAGMAAVPLAFVIWRARDQAQNHYLALTILCAGLHAFFRFGLRALTPDPRWQLTAITMGLLFGLLWLLAYVFLLSTLETPLVAWLRHAWVRWAFTAVYGGLALSTIVAPHLWTDHMARIDGTGIWDNVEGPVGQLEALMALPLLPFAIVAALTAIRHARNAVERRRMQWYAAAFIVNDIMTFTALAAAQTGQHSPDGLQAWQIRLVWTLVPLGNMLWMMGLAYGILRTQLFGIHLRLKLAIESSTVAGVFAGIVLVVSEIIETLFDVDQAVPAIATAVIIAVALRPLVRFGQRVADRLLPNVDDTVAYQERRAREVYEAALAETDKDNMTDRERRLLDALGAQLGVNKDQAEAIDAST